MWEAFWRQCWSETWPGAMAGGEASRHDPWKPHHEVAPASVLMNPAGLSCRYGMYAPGIVGIVFAVVVLLFMRDSPENFGHSPVTTRKPQKDKPAGAAMPV